MTQGVCWQLPSTCSGIIGPAKTVYSAPLGGFLGVARDSKSNRGGDCDTWRRKRSMSGGWLRVTALPNNPDFPRARFLINLDKVWGFNQLPDQPVQVWFSPDPNEAALSIAESIDDIEVQLGLSMGALR